MAALTRAIYIVLCFNIAATSDPPCVIELECRECVPDNMPLVTSHRAANGSVTAAPGDEVVLWCGAGGKFAAYPLRAELAATCEGGRLRVRHDRALRPLRDLGCQEDVFEDVLHEVEHCGAGTGRAYQVQERGGVRHVATLCWDADRGLALFARACNAPHNRLALAAHAERAAPLSLLGNFNHMFDARTRLDAERLYSDDVRLNRRLRELLKHDAVSLAGQALTAGALLAGGYFEDQNSRVADFVSGQVALWGSVARGNLAHAQRDVAALLRRGREAGRALEVFAGAHGVAALRAGAARQELYLKAGGRFPVPRYVWTLVLERAARRALALVVLNEPFVAVSEVREAVFCDSACGRVQWLHELRRNRNYETPVYGLAFCCSVHNFTNIVKEMPSAIVDDVMLGTEGMLLE